MRNQNPAKFDLVVQAITPGARAWILEPQGRRTFKIIVICSPSKKQEQTA